MTTVLAACPFVLRSAAHLGHAASQARRPYHTSVRELPITNREAMKKLQAIKPNSTHKADLTQVSHLY